MKKSAARRRSKQTTSLSLKLEVPADARIKDGPIGKLSINSSLGIGRAKATPAYRHALTLCPLAKPIELEGDQCHWVIKLEKVHIETNEVLEFLGARPIPGPQAYAEKEFERELTRLNAHLEHRDQRFRSPELLSRKEVDVQKAQWRAVSDLLPETIETLKSGRDASIAFAAERFLLTGAVSEKENLKAVLAAASRWKRRRLSMDIVKCELSLGWITKGYEKMGAELVDAIEKATTLRLPIKTIRSLRDNLGLTSDESVKPGRKANWP